MVTHQGTQKIETERLILRRFVIADTREMFENWANDCEVTKYLRWQPHKSVEESKEILAKWIASYQHQCCYNWAIVPKGYGKVIGSITIISMNEDARRCKVGYCIGKNFWGQGIMTEALRAVVHYLLIEVNFNRVQAMHHLDNIASGKVMKKVGMQYEGVLREYSLDNKGMVKDLGLYSVLKSDIFQQVNNFDFINCSNLGDDELELICLKQSPGNPQKNYVPYYTFGIRLVGSSSIIGHVNFRVGFNTNIYYAGHIGFAIDKEYRGHSYAAKACRLLKPLALKHGLKHLLITNNPENIPSRRTCEKLGARLIRIVDLPKDNEMYLAGERGKCIYQWDL